MEQAALPAHASPMDIATFAREVLGKPLYPYQLEVAEAVLASIEGGHGSIITVMMARQAGKNQLSAVLEAYLLATRSEGTIIKAAPTFHPQIHNSYERLKSLAQDSELSERLWHNANTIGLAPVAGSERARRQQGPRVVFYSAGVQSNVVGATAELLLEIDEAQDVEFEKFNRDFRPMVATTNATTVLYGTAWSDMTLLAMQRAANLSMQERGGGQLHFEYDWRRVAEVNPRYRVFVEQEMERLGRDHLIIQTQYCLRSLDGVGYLLTNLQRGLLQGTHAWQEEPEETEGWYIAGLDVGGEQRSDPQALSSYLMRSSGKMHHDSSVLSIARVLPNELYLPCLEVVHQQCWTGLTHPEQYAAISQLIEQWGVRRLAIDATGLGEGLASLLVERFGSERVVPFRFHQASKSHLTYQFLGLVNGGRFKLPLQATAPGALYETCWRQLCLARYRLPAPDLITMYVDAADGHDDFLISLALLGEALHSLTPPIASTRIRPRHTYAREGRY